jgi:hypothetical protein
VTGTEGTATSAAFAVPHMDNRILRDQGDETHGGQTSYTYQLAGIADFRQGIRSVPVDIDESVAIADLIDGCYRRAGLRPRP